LIVAISAFRLETGEGGTGGFELLATSDRPILFDLNTPEGRLELGFSDADNEQLKGWQIHSLRVAAGEDASCLNLYRPTQPRILGVPETFFQHQGFEWSGDDERPAFAKAHSRWQTYPWSRLQADIGQDEAGQPVVPVILDANTAAYSLHLEGIGSQLTVRDAADQPATLRVVGLLKNSVLQGNLLMSEENFLRLFPDTAGYRFFLIDQSGIRPGEDTGSAPATVDAKQIAELLETALADDGFDTVDAREQLAQFLAVQNTYLSTFQSLGALGLLLGTLGLAVVQLRSVLERRGELALMRAAGFGRRRLVRVILWENALLLLGGLAVGCAAAAVALVPQWLHRNASVPWLALAVLLGTVAVAGISAGWLATRLALRAPILPALRGD
jgi:hypothetical protein